MKGPLKQWCLVSDLKSAPESATFDYIRKELINAIHDGIAAKSYLLIKYKSKNDNITTRTIKEYALVEVSEDESPVLYLVGFCLLRQAVRNFRLDRIQNLKELELYFG
ncbi:helix-turn-helix transcriptional regulator [Puia sp. P3]|uniref:helix-turn-helix transcriptional regulator n=1 Tax=Puia sp. P3 TaxID=3423952 RepID=UPI003D67D2F8